MVVDEAGKPHDYLQASGVATAHMTQNFHAHGRAVRGSDLANGGRSAALARLDKSVTEAPGRMVDEAIARWIGTPDDKIRWTANDAARGLFSSRRATITAITPAGIAFKTAAGMKITPDRSDPQLGRLDLAYAMNAHGNQGMTADHAIGVIDSRETNPTNARLFLIGITRSRDSIELIVNDRNRVASAIPA